jgi:hypothetical protein
MRNPVGRHSHLMMRSVNKQKGYIAYTLNILGIKVFSGWCQLIARHGEDWVEIGVRRMLPLDLSEATESDSSDPVVLTIMQYHSACPHDGLMDVVQGKKNFSEALGAH